jgi:DNA-nicking Smr family endonuclease
MKARLKPEDLRIWGLVTATIHPLAGKATADPLPPPAPEVAARIPPPMKVAKTVARPRPALDAIEPGRRHRIHREREPIGARLDLHGLTQDRARAVLESFIRRAWDEGHRAILVITGKGVLGDGVLRRSTPEWLAAPHLSGIVAGVSEAHRKHGGQGALYVALKRRPR